jgi:hypothetical protein
MESEYIGTTNAAEEAIFLRELYASINAAIEGPIKLLTDSEATRNHVRNNVQHSRTKHIDTGFTIFVKSTTPALLISNTQIK